MGLEAGLLKQQGDLATADATAPGEQKVELLRVACHLTDSLFKGILRRIFPDQRKADRLPLPPLVGYLGTIRSSRPYSLGDISRSGFCLLTDERWTPGTEMPITLERTSLPDAKGPESFTVQATVVRCDSNGVGFSIVLCEEDSQAAYGNPLRVRWMTWQEMDEFLTTLKEEPNGESTAPEEPLLSTVVKGKPGLKAAFEGGD